MEQCKVSVIMALYNGSLFVEESIRSVLAQSMNDWELLIVDDGSADNSFEIATKWQQQDVRIKVLTHPNRANKGVSASRNLALNAAKGKYLAILDCDDVWLPLKLEKQLGRLEQLPDVGLMYSLAQVIDDESNLVQEDDQRIKGKRKAVFGTGGNTDIPFDGIDAYFGKKKLLIPASSILCTREAISASGGFEEKLEFQVEDTLFCLKIAEKFPLLFQPEVLVRYRIHQHQWNSRRDMMVNALSHFQLTSLLLQFVQKKHNRKSISKYLVKKNFGDICLAFMIKNSNLIKSYTNIYPFLTRLWNEQQVGFSLKIQSGLIVVLQTLRYYKYRLTRSS